MDVIKYIADTGETKTLTKISLLGKGAFGQVYKYLLDGYGYIACKIQPLKVFKSVLFEAEISPKLTEYSTPLLKIIVNPKHKILFESVNKFVGFCENINVDKIYTLYNIIEGVELKEIIDTHKKNGTYMDKTILMRYFEELLDGLQDMIKNKILHRDIKPGNIMLDKGKIKYIDFGFACMYEKCSDTLQGTPNYISPEGYRKIVEDWSKVDIFALGVVFFCLLTETTIYDHYKFATALKIRDYCKINTYEKIQGEFDIIINGTLPERYKIFLPLILGMTQADPEKRIIIEDAQELLLHIK